MASSAPSLSGGFFKRRVWRGQSGHTWHCDPSLARIQTHHAARGGGRRKGMRQRETKSDKVTKRSPKSDPKREHVTKWPTPFASLLDKHTFFKVSATMRLHHDWIKLFGVLLGVTTCYAGEPHDELEQHRHKVQFPVDSGSAPSW